MWVGSRRSRGSSMLGSMFRACFLARTSKPTCCTWVLTANRPTWTPGSNIVPRAYRSMVLNFSSSLLVLICILERIMWATWRGSAKQ